MKTYFYNALFITAFFSPFAKSELFQSHPVINKKVEKFINVFVDNLFVKELSQTAITLSEKSDMSLGRIEGKFNSLVVEDSSKEPSTVKGDFRFYINPDDGSLLEYGLNFETQFEINQTDNFIFFLKDIFSFCETDSDSDYDNICSAYQSSKWESGESKVKNAAKAFKIWKLYLVDLLYEIEHPEIQAIQEEFVSWVANHILIEEDIESVKMSLDFSNLKSSFSYKAPSFFKQTKLVDYFIESIQIQVFEEQMLFYFHLKKLHVKKRINLYVDLMSQFQSFIEDDTRAVPLAQSLRKDLQEREINISSFLLQLNRGEIFILGWNLGKTIITGSDNEKTRLKPIDSQTEEELGLD